MRSPERAIENVELPLKLTALKKKNGSSMPKRRWNWWGSATGWGIFHGSFRVARNSPSRLRGPSWPTLDLILADEPTGNLDATAAQDVLKLLTRLNQELGKTIVMVTHDPHAAQFASKVRHLEKGDLLPE
jgi:putative ABC transport system ATP-binding protein